MSAITTHMVTATAPNDWCRVLFKADPWLFSRLERARKDSERAGEKTRALPDHPDRVSEGEGQ